MATAGIKYVLGEWLISKQLLIQVGRLKMLMEILREGGCKQFCENLGGRSGDSVCIAMVCYIYNKKEFV